MADNYIERQYEQYEARKAAWEKKKRKQGKKKTISVKLQPKGPDRQYDQNFLEKYSSQEVPMA